MCSNKSAGRRRGRSAPVIWGQTERCSLMRLDEGTECEGLTAELHQTRSVTRSLNNLIRRTLTARGILGLSRRNYFRPCIRKWCQAPGRRRSHGQTSFSRVIRLEFSKRWSFFHSVWACVQQEHGVSFTIERKVKTLFIFSTVKLVFNNLETFNDRPAQRLLISGICSCWSHL